MSKTIVCVDFDLTLYRAESQNVHDHTLIDDLLLAALHKLKGKVRGVVLVSRSCDPDVVMSVLDRVGDPFDDHIIVYTTDKLKNNHLNQVLKLYTGATDADLVLVDDDMYILEDARRKRGVRTVVGGRGQDTVNDLMLCLKSAPTSAM